MESKIKHLRTLILLIIFFLLTPFACKKDPYQANVSHIDLNVTINRLEKDLFSLPLDSIEVSIPGLTNKYGAFFDLFNYRIINIGGSDQPVYPDNKPLAGGHFYCSHLIQYHAGRFCIIR